MEKEKQEDTEELEKEVQKKMQSQSHNKILRVFFYFIGFVVLIFVVWIVVSYNNSHFEYQGIKFVVTSEIAPYRASLLTYQGSMTGASIVENDPIYFYLRNDPRELEYIGFDGEITLLKNLVVNLTGDLKCGGRGIIGTPNLAQLYRVLGITVSKDEKASCDNQGRYMFLQIEEGNETEIQQTGSACYTLKVNDCEILEVTEKFMIETLSKVNELRTR